MDKTKDKTPHYKVFAPTKREDKKPTRWPQVGVCFDHGDKLVLNLDSVPFEKRLVVFKRDPSEKPVEKGE